MVGMLPVYNAGMYHPIPPWVYHAPHPHLGPAHPAAHGVPLPDDEALGSILRLIREERLPRASWSSFLC